MKNITLRQLKVFETLSRHLSFSRAAEELHLTQPAVSMQVRQLEEEVGLPLTEQMGKKIHLTEAGETLARHARVIARQLLDAEEEIAALRGLRGGRLNISVVSTAKYFAPAVLAEFCRRHPEIQLKLGVHNREMVLQQLAANEIDLAIMGQVPVDFPAQAEIFADHPLVVVAAPDHPLAHEKRIPPKRLADEAFIVREQGSGTRAAMERFFAEHGVAVRTGMEMGSNDTIKQAVMAGMGLAFLSTLAVQLELETGRLVVLDVVGLPVIRHWYLVHREGKRLTPPAQAFLEFLLDEGASMIRQRSG